MFLSVLARRLRPGKTYEDFVRAWYPERGYGAPISGPTLARSTADEREILAFAFVDLPSRDDLDGMLTQIAEQEHDRHDRIDEVIESTTVRGIYELVDEFDFSTDLGVTERRPPYLGPRPLPRDS